MRYLLYFLFTAQRAILTCNVRVLFAQMGRVLVLLAFFPAIANAQYVLDDEVSFVYLDGTSTLHDWTVTVGSMQGFLKAGATQKHISKVDEAKIVIPVRSLKSGKEGMDNNMYAALGGGEYPRITYRLVDHIVHNGTITTKGELTIAGVTKMVETTVAQQAIGDHIEIRGNIPFKMTDFNVKPPEFLFGAFTTGDVVTVTFYFMFCDETIKNLKH